MTDSGRIIAVTGGTGFVGRALIARLRAGPMQVRALTRLYREDDDIDWIQGDLGAKAALETLCGGADTVIHIAGLTKAAHIKDLLKVNSEGAANAAQAARAAGVRKFILVSSIAAREPHLSDYAYSKRAGEQAVRAATGDMALTIVRPPAILGPGDGATAPVLSMMRRGWLAMPAGRARRNGRMSFVYMDDVARFLIEQIDAQMPGNTEGRQDPTVLTPYGGTPETGWNDLARAASTVLGRRVRPLPIAPILLAPAALMTQISLGLFGHSSFFNSGKVREMLHSDWTGDSPIHEAKDLETCLRLAFEMGPLNGKE